MARLEYSEALGRKIRSDDWDNIGVSTYTKLKETLQKGNLSEGLELIDYLHTEFKFIHDTFADWTYGLLHFVANRYGEEELYVALTDNFDLLTRAQNALARPFSSVKEIVQFDVESMRAHRCGKGELGNVTVIEEKDRYVVSMDPCGSGGRMRRKGELDGSPPRTEAPYNLGKTKKPYPWSWSQAGVPYYCVKCCVWYEVIPIERRGFPAKISEFPADPNKACIRYYYKSPESIPEEFFARVGKTKDTSKFIR
ncbi:MAG: hypothetical protein ACFFCW_22600 [Candidatus Hodarchaeota archaeon]